MKRLGIALLSLAALAVSSMSSAEDICRTTEDGKVTVCTCEPDHDEKCNNAKTACSAHDQELTCNDSGSICSCAWRNE